MIKIFKFGGASVKNADAVKNVAQIVAAHAPDSALVIVVSAMGKTTNALEDLVDLAYTKNNFELDFMQLKNYHTEIVKDLFADPESRIFELLAQQFYKLYICLSELNLQNSYGQIYDSVVGFGELISTLIVAEYLKKQDLPVRWLDARQIIQTNDTWREGQLDWAWTQRQIDQKLRPLLSANLVVTQGFIGQTPQGQTTTLGREGSDYTAAILAGCLKAHSLTIWKDVPGVLSADPKIQPDAVLFGQLSYQDAAEMTYYGATVIHPKTIKPIANHNIPLFVRSFIDQKAPGTRIGAEQVNHLPPAFIYKKKQRLIEFRTKDLNFFTEQKISSILQGLERSQLKLNMMQAAALSFSICTENEQEGYEKIKNLLSDEFDISSTDLLTLITIKNPDQAAINKILKMGALLLCQHGGNAWQGLFEE